jgi:hypothetical protein
MRRISSRITICGACYLLITISSIPLKLKLLQPHAVLLQPLIPSEFLANQNVPPMRVERRPTVRCTRARGGKIKIDTSAPSTTFFKTQHKAKNSMKDK